MRKFILLTALAAILLPSFASASYEPKIDQWGFRQRHAQRAAPWFLYWPYEAYWGTPAPTGVAPLGPMGTGPFQQQIQQNGYGPSYYPGYNGAPYYAPGNGFGY